MFGAAAGYGAARARYRQVDLTSKVEGASPHRLIAILYEELLKSLDILSAALAQGANRIGLPERRSRVNTVLLGLEASLDHRNGGEIARGLTAIYRQARRLVGEGVDAGDPAPVREAHAMILEIAEAWAQIG